MSTDLLQAPGLGSIAGAEHAFETRSGRLTDVLPEPVLRLHQVHGSTVRSVDEETGLEPFLASDPVDRPAADALVSARTGLTLAVATADCVPVLLADRSGRAVAAAHAGWRGLALGILPATLGVLAREHGVLPDQTVVALGPAVGACCYRVAGDVRAAFASAGIAEGTFAEPVEEDRDGDSRTTWNCDLHAAARTQLTSAGVLPDRIDVVSGCTRCLEDRFHSYRRDGEAAGRQLSGISAKG